MDKEVREIMKVRESYHLPSIPHPNVGWWKGEERWIHDLFSFVTSGFSISLVSDVERREIKGKCRQWIQRWDREGTWISYLSWQWVGDEGTVITLAFPGIIIISCSRSSRSRSFVNTVKWTPDHLVLIPWVGLECRVTRWGLQTKKKTIKEKDESNKDQI